MIFNFYFFNTFQFQNKSIFHDFTFNILFSKFEILNICVMREAVWYRVSATGLLSYCE